MIRLDTLANDVAQKQLGIYAIVVTKDGAEQARQLWRVEERNNIHSLSKSFCSLAAGMAIEEGLFGLDDKVIGFFEDKLDQAPSPFLESLTIRHLLTMSSGHPHPLLMGNQRDKLDDLDWVHYFLNQPFAHKPGEQYLYDTGNTYLVSAILQKQSGQTLTQYLKPRLFAPLNIRNPQWFKCPKGIDLGGGGLHLSVSEIATFGQLLLQHGNWEGKQLVPRWYLDLATTKQIETAPTHDKHDWVNGYGFQFWMNSHRSSYRGDGAYGQFCVVLPEENAHVAITAHEERNTQGLLDLIWDHIIPQL